MKDRIVTSDHSVSWDCKLKAILTLLLMTVGSLLMLLVACITLFQAGRLYREKIASPLGRLALWIWGIRVVVHDRPADSNIQCVYVSNHTSTIDVFVLIALALPNTRFFMSGFLRKLLPLGLIGYLMGMFWTVPQDYPERRAEIFKRAERTLRKTRESVYLSPEGERITSGQVGHFNKGAFHLAASLQAPIVPFFIYIPKEVDTGMGFCAQPGRVDVYFKPKIDVSDWRLEDLIENKENVRDQFVKWHHELHRN